MYRLLLWIITILFTGVLPFRGFNGGRDYIDPVFGESGYYMQSVGEARVPVFMVSFQDVTYRRNRVTKDDLTEWLFAQDGSVTAYYDTASYGRLHIGGGVFFY